MSENDPSWPNDGGDTSGDGAATPPPQPPAGATPPPPAPAPSGGPAPGAQGTATHADLGIRFGARVLDAILLWIVSLVIVVPIFVGMVFADAGGFGMMGGGGMAVNLLSSVIVVAIYLAYYVFMDTRFGWTLGKKVLNLEVKGAAGGLPTVEESLKRNAWLALQIIPFIGWLAQLAAAIYIAVTINSSDTNDGWHDEFAGGTKVVRTA